MPTNLIPTAVVDKNGKSTTVHRRPAGASGVSRSLAAAKPVLKAVQQPSVMDDVVTIKGKSPLSEDSIIMRYPGYFESQWIQYGRDYYAWRDNDAEITNGEIYDYLRFGIDPVEASVLKQMDIPASLFDTDEFLKTCVPGSVGILRKGKGVWCIEVAKTAELLRSNDIPAERAAKMIKHGLNDRIILDTKLSVEQLGELFEKWNYDEASYSEGNLMINALCDGRIPFELFKTNSRTELIKFNNELRVKDNRAALENRLVGDRELFVRVASKALKSVRGDAPVARLFQIIDRFGEDALRLKNPTLAEDRWMQSEEPFGVEGAAYLDAVQKLIAKSKSGVSGDWSAHHEIKYEQYLGWSLKGADFIQLADAGATPEQALDLLETKHLTVTQALSVVADGTPVALADGVL